ncbi:hypothetical protein WG70_23180 [Burkholderia oklahomensis EO147]|nr:hypothetical protein WG70_23180 [Burkholderia oklahomensis EO147]KUY68774.1 hypothetical protein WG70_24680 [Burkholderia oklahomensis EO147]
MACSRRGRRPLGSLGPSSYRARCARRIARRRKHLPKPARPLESPESKRRAPMRNAARALPHRHDDA